MRYFIEQGIEPKRFIAVGYADAAPKVSNRDGAGNVIPENQVQNERMVIKFQRE